MNIPEESKRFKKFRQSLGLTQIQMADVLSTKQTIVSKYESGSLQIPLEVVKILRLQYNLNYEWFFHGVGKMKIDGVERNTITTDLKNLLLDNDLTKKKLEQFQRDLIKLIRKVDDLSHS